MRYIDLAILLAVVSSCNQVPTTCSDSISTNYYGDLNEDTINTTIINTKDCSDTNDLSNKNYSYQELKNTEEIIRLNLKLASELKIGISSFGINDKSNRIDLGLEKCDEKHIKLFKDNIIDSPMIEFVEGNFCIDD